MMAIFYILWLLFMHIRMSMGELMLMMNLPRGSRVKLSEFWNLKNVSCGDMTNGLYRHGYIDNQDDLTCIFSIYLYFDSSHFLKYVQTTFHIDELLASYAAISWRAISSSDNFLVNTDSNYKFLWLNDKNDTLYAGVYQRDDSVSPLFIYSQNGSSFSVDKHPSSLTEIIMTDNLQVKYVIKAPCVVPSTTIYSHIDTCPVLPVINTTQTTVIANQSQTVTLHCLITAGLPTSIVYWKKYVNGVFTNILGITSGGTVSFTSLVFPSVEVTDSGTYSCFAQNSVGVSNSSLITLTLHPVDDLCPCACTYTDNINNRNTTNYTMEEMYVILAPAMRELEKLLKVDKRNLSSYINKRISATDDRTSSRSLGFGGVMFLCLIVSGIIAIDLSNVKDACPRSKLEWLLNLKYNNDEK